VELARTRPRMFMPVLRSAACGLRRGEVAASRWKAANLDAAQLSVVATTEQTKDGLREKPPKSGKSRTVALPPIVVEELRRHRLQQAQELLRLGIRQNGDTQFCLREDGMPWSPRMLTMVFMRLIKASGLPRIRLHDLRHSHATHLLTAKIHPKVVQERLGHATISMTMDLYSHVMPGMQEEAAATIDATLRSAMKKHGSRYPVANPVAKSRISLTPQRQSTLSQKGHHRSGKCLSGQDAHELAPADPDALFGAGDIDASPGPVLAMERAKSTGPAES